MDPAERMQTMSGSSRAISNDFMSRHASSNDIGMYRQVANFFGEVGNKEPHAEESTADVFIAYSPGFPRGSLPLHGFTFALQLPPGPAYAF